MINQWLGNKGLVAAIVAVLLLATLAYPLITRRALGRLFTLLAALSLLTCVAGIVFFGINYLVIDRAGWQWFYHHNPAAYWQILGQRIVLCTAFALLPACWVIAHRRRRLKE
jgi:glucan phosphoethanolaminetransferase (alkaline phosphatase superfamily)